MATTPYLAEMYPSTLFGLGMRLAVRSKPMHPGARALAGNVEIVISPVRRAWTRVMPSLSARKPSGPSTADCGVALDEATDADVAAADAVDADVDAVDADVDEVVETDLIAVDLPFDEHAEIPTTIETTIKYRPNRWKVSLKSISRRQLLIAASCASAGRYT